MFWNHRKEDRIDNAFIRFISTALLIRLSFTQESDRLINISKIQEDPNFVKPQLFCEEDYKYLSRCLDIYSNYSTNNIEITVDIPFFQHKPDNNLFTAIVTEGKNSSYTQKVLFFAQTEYLLSVDIIDPDFFHDWMRVIRNIVSRGDVERNGKRPTIIRSPGTFDGVIKLIHELSQGCENIYQHLSTTENITSNFAKRTSC